VAGTERDEEFRRFAVAQRRTLLRTTWLLTGNRGAAEDLAQTALLATRRRFRRPEVRADPAAAARRAVVAALTGRWPRTVRSAQVIGTMPEGTPDPDAVRDDEQVRAALQELPARVRAAVVLRLHDDLDDEQLAAALGTPAAAAAALAAEGVARLAPVVGVPAGGPQRGAGSALRDRLDAAAWRATAGGDDARAAGAVLGLARSRRRRLALGAVAVAALAVVAVVVPAHRGGQEPDFPTPATVSPPRTDPGVRGSLGGDRAFVDALRNRDWPELGLPAPSLTTRRVLFAGDAGGYRWGLVTGTAAGVPLSVWFSGPVGAAPGDLTASSLEGGPGAAIAGTERSDPGGAVLLVLAEQGDEVLVSPGVVVGADGRAGREYRPVPVQGGIASTRVAGANVGGSVRYRVVRDGVLVGTGPLGDDGLDLHAASALAAQTPQRPSTAPATTDAVSKALSGVLRPTGLGTDDVHPVVLWATSLHTSGGGTAELTSVVSTMPSGALVVATGLSGDVDGRGRCASMTYPAGTRIADLVLATSCVLDLAGTPTQRSFVVSAPPTTSQVALVNGNGTVLVQQPLTDGAAVVPDPGTVAGALVSTPGRPDERAAVPNTYDYDPLQVY
jgi:DNA-directed RNA polymerase specialized sigma24 family protein